MDDELFAQQGRIESLLVELGAWSCQGQCQPSHFFSGTSRQVSKVLID